MLPPFCQLSSPFTENRWIVMDRLKPMLKSGFALPISTLVVVRVQVPDASDATHFTYLMGCSFAVP